MLNNMVLFLGVPEQGLMGKIDVFLANLWNFACFRKQSGNFNCTLLLSDMNFNNLSVLGDEANYVVCQTSICLDMLSPK